MMKRNLCWALLLLSWQSIANELELIGSAVQLHGRVVAQACSVAADSLDQLVNLGVISPKLLESSYVGPKTPFKIRLTGCSTAAYKNAVFTFTGATVYRGDLIGLAFSSGSASGAGVFLSDKPDLVLPPHLTIRIGYPTPAYLLTDGVTELTFYAQVGRGRAQASGNGPLPPVVPGDFSAVTTFVVAYQ